MDGLHLARSIENHELEVAQRVGLEGFEIVNAWGKFVGDDIGARESLEIHVAVRKHFIKGEDKARFSLAGNAMPDEASEVASQIQDAELMSVERKTRIGCI